MIYDDKKKKMYIKGKEIDFRRKKVTRKILEYLIKNRGRWSTKEEISEAVYGELEEERIRMEISRLRKILGEGIEIKRKNSIGYRIEVKE